MLRYVQIKMEIWWYTYEAWCPLTLLKAVKRSRLTIVNTSHDVKFHSGIIAEFPVYLPQKVKLDNLHYLFFHGWDALHYLIAYKWYILPFWRPIGPSIPPVCYPRRNQRKQSLNKWGNLQCQRLWNIFMCPTYKLPLSSTIISDDIESSISNKNTLTKYCLTQWI